MLLDFSAYEVMARQAKEAVMYDISTAANSYVTTCMHHTAGCYRVPGTLYEYVSLQSTAGAVAFQLEQTPYEYIPGTYMYILVRITL